MQISTNFDSGSITVLSAETPHNIRLKLRGDTRSSDNQWFYFELRSRAGETHTLTIEDVGSSTFAAGWPDYQVVASYDGECWFRVPTDFDGENLIINHTLCQDVVRYAYFPPYGQARQQRLLTTALKAGRCQQITLGLTPEQRPIDLLVFDHDSVKDAAHKKKIWLIARQHPGETMAQWFVEGVLEQLLSNDAAAQSLLQAATFYVIANMNPDGSALGNHRTNAAGINLNSVWQEPSPTDAPEVFHVRRAMHEAGVDLFLDIHGDEEIPHAFMMGGKSSPELSLSALAFKRHYAQVNPNFQLAYDYDTYPRATGKQRCCSSLCGKVNARVIATDYVESAFGCLSLLLEMPFKVSRPDDPLARIDPQAVCKGLGASLVETLLHHVDN